jgi:hypothetical protein
MDVNETSCEDETWINLIYIIPKYDWILCNVVYELSGLITV